jgi:hypothetical protein
LVARTEAFQRGQLIEFDMPREPCRLYHVPGTDMPPHFGGVAFKPLMHIINGAPISSARHRA